MSDSATPWTIACQTPLSTGFSRQEYWSGLPFPSPGDLPNPGIETGSPASQVDSLPYEPPGKPSMITGLCNAGGIIPFKIYIDPNRLGCSYRVLASHNFSIFIPLYLHYLPSFSLSHPHRSKENFNFPALFFMHSSLIIYYYCSSFCQSEGSHFQP